MREVGKNIILLSDFEALQVALDYSARYGGASHGAGSLQSPIKQMNTVHLELLRHLQNKEHPRPCAAQSAENITAFLAALRSADLSPPPGPRREEGLAEHHLTKTERLMLVNATPTTQVFLGALVEEVFTRFTQEQIEHILDLVRTYLLPPATDMNGVAEGEGSGNAEEGVMLDEDEYLNS